MNPETRTEPSATPASAPDAWAERQRYWQRRLGRLRLGAEPLEEQLDRYRRVTLALTLVPAVIALMFVALFTAFGAPGTGLIVAGILYIPLVTLAWLDFARLRARAASYLRERDAQEPRHQQP